MKYISYIVRVEGKTWEGMSGYVDLEFPSLPTVEVLRDKAGDFEHCKVVYIEKITKTIESTAVATDITTIK